MSDHYKASESAFACITYARFTQKINDKIVQSNANYKLRVDVKKHVITFNVGDYVMIRIRPERFPPEP